MSLHLVTGHSGKAHITAADQGALNACQFGADDYVLKSGEQFAASVITNNQIRIADGEVMMQGRHIRLARGTYEDVMIENGSQGTNRNDLIVIRYMKNADSGIEKAALAVIKGEETTAAAVDPEHTSGDILAGDCVLHEMPLYRVPLSGITVGELVPLFEAAHSNAQFVRLWENDSQTAAFEAQDVPIENIRDYELFVVAFRMATNNARRISAVTQLPTYAQSGIYGEAQYIGNLESTSGNMFMFRRYLISVEGKISFEKCSYKQNTTITENNSYLIPVAVYGIKGISPIVL